MKTPLQQLRILALACMVVLNAADTSRDVTLAGRGLPEALFNNDGDDLV
jgi:hypothetical protein